MKRRDAAAQEVACICGRPPLPPLLHVLETTNLPHTTFPLAQGKLRATTPHPNWDPEWLCLKSVCMFWELHRSPQVYVTSEEGEVETYDGPIPRGTTVI